MAPNRSSMIASIEGLPGAGKTTTAARVAERLNLLAVRETTGDHPFLTQVYDDTDRDDLTVELAFLIVHANAYRRLDRAMPTVVDFSPVKDLLFAEDMLASAELEFFRQAYQRLYDGHLPPDVVIYLRVDPELCLARIRRRYELDPSRLFEQGATLERLQRMHDRYEAGKERLGRDVLVYEVDTHANEDRVADDVASLLHMHVGRSPMARRE
jgi:deoxyadenosine/deoxycytidine kinase